LPGYINVDIREDADVVADLRVLPFEDESADEILSVHVVEHFYPWEIGEMLDEWIRVLKPGGKMILECPNIMKAAQYLLDGQHDQFCMWVFWGDPGHRNPYMMHKWGYTPETLSALMARHRLREIVERPAQFKLKEKRDFRVEGIK